MTTKTIEAVDKNGVRRCYGIAPTRQRAINYCIESAREYLKTRPDIDVLFLTDDNGKPVFDAATYSQWEIKQ